MNTMNFESNDRLLDIISDNLKHYEACSIYASKHNACDCGVQEAMDAVVKLRCIAVNDKVEIIQEKISVEKHQAIMLRALPKENERWIWIAEHLGRIQARLERLEKENNLSPIGE